MEEAVVIAAEIEGPVVELERRVAELENRIRELTASGAGRKTVKTFAASASFDDVAFPFLSVEQRIAVKMEMMRHTQ